MIVLPFYRAKFIPPPFHDITAGILLSEEQEKEMKTDLGGSKHI